MIFCVISQDPSGGGGDSYMERAWMRVENFEKNPLKDVCANCLCTSLLCT